MFLRESDEARLRELCDELLGPVHLGPSSQSNAGEKLHSWESDILVSTYLLQYSLHFMQSNIVSFLYYGCDDFVVALLT